DRQARRRGATRGARPALAERLKRDGVEPVGNTPQAFGEVIAREPRNGGRWRRRPGSPSNNDPARLRRRRTEPWTPCGLHLGLRVEILTVCVSIARLKRDKKLMPSRPSTLSPYVPWPSFCTTTGTSLASSERS